LTRKKVIENSADAFSEPESFVR